MRAFILVKTGEPEKMKEYLESVDEVREVHIVYGGYDVVVVVDVPSVEALGRIVFEEIRNRFPVEETLTLISVY